MPHQFVAYANITLPPMHLLQLSFNISNDAYDNNNNIIVYAPHTYPISFVNSCESIQ